MRRQLTGILAVLLSTTTAYAASDTEEAERPTGARAFAFFDQDGDGLLTLSEFAEGRRKRFDRMDVDGDQKVTRAEMTEATSERQSANAAPRAFDRMDQDQSDDVSLAEFDAFGTVIFDRMDANKDSFLSEEEQSGFGVRRRQFETTGSDS